MSRCSLDLVGPPCARAAPPQSTFSSNVASTTPLALKRAVITTGRILVEGGSGLFALTNDDTVSCIDRPSNDAACARDSLDNGFAQYPLQRYVDTMIGLTKSNAAYTLHVTSVSIDNGSTIASVNIPVNLAKDLPRFILLMPDIGLADETVYRVTQDESARVMRYNGVLTIDMGIYRR
ncbi:hypothetical protein F5J12DRAFT_913669, partial [Pisolithus orientalis]|uniref:uncharacterized protein n=1 Tax=Pisolithus orientalis TaxID=936130 RepID=UPI002224F517